MGTLLSETGIFGILWGMDVPSAEAHGIWCWLLGWGELGDVGFGVHGRRHNDIVGL